MTQPVVILNHPHTPALRSLVNEEAPPDVVLVPAYQQLVTRHNVAPEKAKQLLGWTK